MKRGLNPSRVSFESDEEEEEEEEGNKSYLRYLQCTNKSFKGQPKMGWMDGSCDLGILVAPDK